MSKVLFLLIFIVIVVAFILLLIICSNKKRNSYPEGNHYRMLCRSHNNRVIAGVCGGIAEYFGWSATAVRLFFILTGVGIFTYILLAIVIPDSPSSLL